MLVLTFRRAGPTPKDVKPGNEGMSGRIQATLAFAALVAGALLALEAPAQPGRAITALAPRQFQKRDYPRVPTGRQQGGIGIFAGREDEAPTGPSSFTVDEAGEVTIL